MAENETAHISLRWRFLLKLRERRGEPVFVMVLVAQLIVVEVIQAVHIRECPRGQLQHSRAALKQLSCSLHELKPYDDSILAHALGIVHFRV